MKRRADRVPFRVQPMLATLVEEPFHRPGWVYLGLRDDKKSNEVFLPKRFA